jgi:hypothetical protein
MSMISAADAMRPQSLPPSRNLRTFSIRLQGEGGERGGGEREGGGRGGVMRDV